MMLGVGPEVEIERREGGERERKGSPELPGD